MPRYESDSGSNSEEYDSDDVGEEEESDDESVIDICTEIPGSGDFGEGDAEETDEEGEDEGGDMAMADIPGADDSRGAMWDVGKTLRVRFMGGSSKGHSAVKKYARVWEKHANIHFKFVDHAPSNIRISFDKDKGWNSHVGTYNERIFEHKPTMNLAVTSKTSETSLRRHILHEFGHALGCIHEHSSPASSIPWNKKAVYAHYRKQGWNTKQTDNNVLNAKPASQFSRFDRHSIMLYPVPKSLTRNGYSAPWNTELSDTDKRFIRKMYPF